MEVVGGNGNWSVAVDVCALLIQKKREYKMDLCTILRRNYRTPARHSQQPWISGCERSIRRVRSASLLSCQVRVQRVPWRMYNRTKTRWKLPYAPTMMESLTLRSCRIPYR